MTKYKQLSVKSRIERISDLIKDREQLGFNKQLVTGFKKQLRELQAEAEADKEQAKKFNATLLRERNLKKVGDSKPLRALNKPLRMA